MKNRRKPSASLILSALALFCALGGTAVAFGVGRNSVHSRNLAPLKLRTTKLTSSDAAAGDGRFTDSVGSARCKRGEQLITGGVRFRGALDTGGLSGLRAAVLDSGPVAKPQSWRVTISSDLGTETRSDFTVFAYCLVK